MATRIFNGIKFCEQFCEADLPRNIPTKFGSTWPRGLEKMFIEIVDDAHWTTDTGPP